MKKGISFLFYKITLLLALICFSTLSFAGGPEAPPPPSFDGFYFVPGLQGVLIRPSQASLQQFSAAVATGVITNFITKVQSPPWKMNAAVQLGLEWGHVFHFSDPYSGLYFGTNVNFLTGGNWIGTPNVPISVLGAGNVTFPGQVFTFHYQLTQNYVFNVLAKLGYAWEQYLVYLQLGLAAANVTAHVPSVTTVVGGYSASYQWDPGYSGGVGVEVMLTPRMILGLNYLYTRYNSLKIRILGAVYPSGQAYQGWLTNNFQTQRIGIYLKYKFAL